VSTTVYDVLDQLRATALDERNKGDLFERLVKAILEKDPFWTQRFTDVQMWNDWEGRAGVRDIGIDLVAKNRDDEGWSVIQCKFYEPGKRVSKSDIDGFLSLSYRPDFNVTQRYVFDTADGWSGNAEETLKGQVQRIDISWLDEAGIDWSGWTLDTPDQVRYTDRKRLRPHQREALQDVHGGLIEHDRGKLIMACGTGKTFTSLKIAEHEVGAGGTVLFLAPSIQLVSQSLREWMAETEVGIRPFAVCSDVRVGRDRNQDDADLSTVDLPEPATTNATKLVERFGASDASDRMTVVFSTYQSIDVIIAAQKQGLPEFDLVICDEAHRTSGVTSKGGEHSDFVKVHDNNRVHAKKRIYMTATPRVYDESVKRKADEAEAVLFDMADEATFGPELHRLGFGEAVERDLLSDYKVLVLAVDEGYINSRFLDLLNNEIPLSEAAKLVGCWNGLDKHFTERDDAIKDWRPMKTAVAFAQNIKASKAAAEVFPQVGDYVNAALGDDGDRKPLALSAKHVDGTMGIHERNAKLHWLKTSDEDGTCRVLSNAKCLSEGVDVPSLDAVLFLSGRSSQVDVVQAVGRVMRKAPGKELGYIILPVAIPAGVAPEEALKDNARYKVVWQVLQALRSHDDRFNAEINKIDLNKRRSARVSVITVTDPTDTGYDNRNGAGDDQHQLAFVFDDAQVVDAMYARIVQKVGERHYWPKWAAEVAQIAESHITRIKGLLADPASRQAKEFEAFLGGLRGNLNDNITEDEAIEMLAQHLITRPIFEALFEGYAFAAHNPVAQVMERMLAVLDEHSLDAENQTLDAFYKSVRRRVEGVDNTEGKQRILIDLYDNFFKAAFRRSQEKLGIVYTPVEVADFILRSADAVLRQEFGQGLTDEGVHILDGFTGTGTFIVRLLQSGLVQPSDLARKYEHEIHANEILLLAYYIASVNIENAYLEITGAVEAFPGLILTDTFQSWEPDDRPDLNVFPENNKRLEALKKLPITVIVGNPPYSVGQDSANDANQNESYPALDNEIRTSYVERSGAGLVRNMYDSYIRAIKWSSLRIRDRGVIAYVTNGGFLDSKSADGLRKTLAEEFSAIYVYNLRGNQYAGGEQSRREGGKIFGGGSRATVAITILAKNPSKTGPAVVQYADIGDYLSREEKLAQIADAGSFADIDTTTITPNSHGDWLNQRSGDFDAFIPLRGAGGVFLLTSPGVSTNRDAWTVNSSRNGVRAFVEQLMSAYNQGVSTHVAADEIGPTSVSWSRGLKRRYETGTRLPELSQTPTVSLYRPFFRQWLATDRPLLEAPGRSLEMFAASNYGFATTGPAANGQLAVLMASVPPNLHFMDSGQFFPRWRYEQAEHEGTLFSAAAAEVIDGRRRSDNITDGALAKFRATYPAERVTKDDIFFYIYGLLHSPEYREMYAADLKKMLPRVPLVREFPAFANAGRRLSELHLGYETVDRYPLAGLDVEPPGGADPYQFFAVGDKKIRFGNKNKDKSVIEYNGQVTLSGVPQDAYRYMLGSRSAIEWLIDRYYVKTDKDSGIVNDPNYWSREVGDPRYILDLFARVTTVSVETMKIVDDLPSLDIIEAE
jgi:predicted helicase